MGLNAKEIAVCFLRMIQVSTEASFTFIRRHPLISGVLLILCILYLFLSYIYHFLVYLSQFLVCAAIFVRIFWSSEEGHLSYIKKDEKKEEPKEIEKELHKLPSYGKRDMLLERRYSSRNATSRRRNFTDKKWDVQDAAVEAIGKESSSVESCGSEKKDAKSSENEENSSNFSEKLQKTDTEISPLQSAASISELVKASDSDKQNNKSDDCSDGLACEKEKNSSDYAAKSQNTDAQVSPSESEPSISDQVKTSDSDQQNNESDSCSSKPAFEKEDTAEAKEEKEEEGEDEGEGDESQDEEESQEETNKVVEWSKDDQKNLMDLGISEMERNRRLESLIARRRARQQMKLQEQGLNLTDLRNTPSRMAPLNIARTDPLKSPRNYGGIDGLEIPGSAPSALRPLRNPFDLPYDASEEKPNLTGDSFDQEFIPKDMTFCRHESFSYGASLQFDEESYPFFINGRRISDRFRRLPDEGNHDLIIEKLFSKSLETGVGISTGVRAPKPLLVKFETTDQENTKSKTDNVFGLKWKKLVNAATAQMPKPFSDHHTSESSFMENINHGFVETHLNNKISNNDKFGVSEKPEESKTHHHKSTNKKYLNFPIATGTAFLEAPLDSLSSPTIKNEEDMPFPERCIFHEPTCSIASDLQVEFSEIGSPTTLTMDGESMVFDGEIDKETVLTPRSDELGPISINLRSCDEGIAELSNISPQSSPVPLRQKVEEEDVIDVSSLSSTSDLRGDSPTHEKINYDYNIFSDMRKDDVETQKTHPSNFLIDRSVDHHPPHETQPQKPEERQNLSKDSETEAQVVDHDANSPSSTSGDSPTHEKISYDYNVFSDMKKDEVETQATQPSNSSDFLISRSVDYPPQESQSEKPEETQNLSENSEAEEQILDHHVTDSSTNDIENSNSNEDLRAPVVHQHQESIDAVSMKTFSSLSPRSLSPDMTLMDLVSSSALNQHISTDVPQLNIEDMIQEPPTSELLSNIMPPIMQSLSIDPVALTHTSVPRSLSPEKTLMDLVSSSAFNQHISTDVPQVNIEDMTQEPPTCELPSKTMPPIMQPLSIDPVAPTHTSVSSDFQEPTCSSTMADDYKTTDKSGKLIFDDVDRKENDTLMISRNKDPADPHVNPVEEKISLKENDAGQEKFKNGVRSEDKSTSVTRQGDSIQSLTSSQMKTLDEINNKSEVVESDEVTLSPSKVTENVGVSTTIEDGQMAAELAQLADVHPPKPNKPTGNLEEVSDVHSESKKDGNEEEIKGESKDEIPPKPSMLNDSSEKENNVHSEPMKNEAEINEKLKNYIPENPGETNDSSEQANEAQSESRNNDPKIGNKEEIKAKLKNDTITTKLDKPNDNWDEVSKVPSESKKNHPEISNKEETKNQLSNDIPTKPNKPNDSSEKVSKIQSEPKQNDPEMSNKVEINVLSNNDTSAKTDKQIYSTGEVSKVQSEPNDSFEKVSDVQSESRKDGAEISSKENVKEKLGNDISSEPNDNLEKVSDKHEEPKKVEDDMEKHKSASVNIPKVNEVTSSSSVEVGGAKNNEVIEQESNKKEATMVLSSSLRTSQDGITINVKEPEGAVKFEK